MSDVAMERPLTHEEVKARHVAQFGALLTYEQWAALADYTMVIVTWTGGNGPHVYRKFGDQLWRDQYLVGWWSDAAAVTLVVEP